MGKALQRSLQTIHFRVLLEHLLGLQLTRSPSIAGRAACTLPPPLSPAAGSCPSGPSHLLPPKRRSTTANCFSDPWLNMPGSKAGWKNSYLLLATLAASEREPAVALKTKTRKYMQSKNKGRLSLSGEALKMKFILPTSQCGHRKGRNASFPSCQTCKGGSEISSWVFLPYVPSRTRQAPNFPICCATQPSPTLAPPSTRQDRGRDIGDGRG